MNERTAALLHLLFCIATISGVDGRGVLSIKLREFHNPSGRTFDGGCCDAGRRTDDVYTVCGDGCDYVMRLIVSGLGRANDHVFLFHRPLKYNSNDVVFPHHDYNMVLTVLFDQWPVHDRVKMSAFFYDYDDLDHTTTLVDWFVTDLRNGSTYSSGDSTGDGRTPEHFQSIVGKRRHNKTKLAFEWAVMCSDGDDCNQPPSNRRITLPPTTPIFKEFEQVHVGKHPHYNNGVLQNIEGAKYPMREEDKSVINSVLYQNINNNSEHGVNSDDTRISSLNGRKNSIDYKGIAQRDSSRIFLSNAKNFNNPSITWKQNKHSSIDDSKDNGGINSKIQTIINRKPEEKAEMERPVHKPLVSAAAAATPPPHAYLGSSMTSHKMAPPQSRYSGDLDSRRSSVATKGHPRKHNSSLGNLHNKILNSKHQHRTHSTDTRNGLSTLSRGEEKAGNPIPTYNSLYNNNPNTFKAYRNFENKIKIKEAKSGAPILHNKISSSPAYQKSKLVRFHQDPKQQNHEQPHATAVLTGYKKMYSDDYPPLLTPVASTRSPLQWPSMTTQFNTGKSQTYRIYLDDKTPQHNMENVERSLLSSHIGETYVSNKSQSLSSRNVPKIQAFSNSLDKHTTVKQTTRREKHYTHPKTELTSRSFSETSKIKVKPHTISDMEATKRLTKADLPNFIKRTPQFHSKGTTPNLLKNSTTEKALDEHRSEAKTLHINRPKQDIESNHLPQKQQVNETRVTHVSIVKDTLTRSAAVTEPTQSKSKTKSWKQEQHPEWKSDTLADANIIPNEGMNNNSRPTKDIGVSKTSKKSIRKVFRPDNIKILYNSMKKLKAVKFLTQAPVEWVVTGHSAFNQNRWRLSDEVLSRTAMATIATKSPPTELFKSRGNSSTAQQISKTKHQNRLINDVFRFPSTMDNLNQSATYPNMNLFTSTTPSISIIKSFTKDYHYRRVDDNTENKIRGKHIPTIGSKEYSGKRLPHSSEHEGPSKFGDKARASTHPTTTSPQSHQNPMDISILTKYRSDADNMLKHQQDVQIKDGVHAGVKLSTNKKKAYSEHMEYVDKLSSEENQISKTDDLNKKFKGTKTLKTNSRQIKTSAESLRNVHSTLGTRTPVTDTQIKGRRLDSHKSRDTFNKTTKYSVKSEVEKAIPRSIISYSFKMNKSENGRKQAVSELQRLLVDVAKPQNNITKMEITGAASADKHSRETITDFDKAEKKVKSIHEFIVSTGSAVSETSKSTIQRNGGEQGGQPLLSNVTHTAWPTHQYNKTDSDIRKHQVSDEADAKTSVNLHPTTVNKKLIGRTISTQHLVLKTTPDIRVSLVDIFNERHSNLTVTMAPRSSLIEHTTDLSNATLPNRRNSVLLKLESNEQSSGKAEQTSNHENGPRLLPLQQTYSAANKLIRKETTKGFKHFQTKSPIDDDLHSNSESIQTLRQATTKEYAYDKQDTAFGRSHEIMKGNARYDTESYHKDTEGSKNTSVTTHRISKHFEKVPGKDNRYNESTDLSNGEQHASSTKTSTGDFIPTTNSSRQQLIVLNTTSHDHSTITGLNVTSLVHRMNSILSQIQRGYKVKNLNGQTNRLKSEMSNLNNPNAISNSTLFNKAQLEIIFENLTSTTSLSKTVEFLKDVLKNSSHNTNTTQNILSSLVVHLNGVMASLVENKTDIQRDDLLTTSTIVNKITEVTTTFEEETESNRNYMKSSTPPISVEDEIENDITRSSTTLIHVKEETESDRNITRPSTTTTGVKEETENEGKITRSSTKFASVREANASTRTRNTTRSSATPISVEEETESDENITRSSITPTNADQHSKKKLTRDISTVIMNTSKPLVSETVNMLDHAINEQDIFVTKASPVTSKPNSPKTSSYNLRFSSFPSFTFIVKTLPDEGFKLHTQTPDKDAAIKTANKIKLSTIILPDPKLVTAPKTRHVPHTLPVDVNIHRLRKYLFKIRKAPKVDIPAKGLFEEESVTEPEVPSTVISSADESHQQAGPATKRHLMDLKTVFKRYWPAVFGLVVGTVFLLSALITSLVCRQRRLLIQRDRWTDSPQHLSEPPDTSEYATSSVVSLNSDFARSSTNLV